MAKHLNQIVIEGNLGRDLRFNYLPSGIPVAEITIASSDDYKKNDEWITHTVWTKAKGWRNVAEAMNEMGLAKGDRVIITGKLDVPEHWTDNNGEIRVQNVITIDTIRKVEKPARASDGGGSYGSSGSSNPDDIPF